MHRQGQPQDFHVLRKRQALDLRRRPEPDNYPQDSIEPAGDAHYAKPPDFQKPRKQWRRLGAKLFFFHGDHYLVIGDEHCPHFVNSDAHPRLIDQPERQIRLAAAGRPQKQDALPFN